MTPNHSSFPVIKRLGLLTKVWLVYTPVKMFQRGFQFDDRGGNNCLSCKSFRCLCLLSLLGLLQTIDVGHDKSRITRTLRCGVEASNYITRLPDY